MKRLGTMLVGFGLLALAACDIGTAVDTDTVPPTAPEAVLPADLLASDTAPTTKLSGSAANDTPPFAAIYPGAKVDQRIVATEGAPGPGGALTFIADAGPDAVVDFYRQRAEAAGLASLTALSQGETRAYGAAGDSGASVQVVAAPDGDGRTSVQLTWSSGR